jgi:hypothetical protein
VRLAMAGVFNIRAGYIEANGREPNKFLLSALGSPTQA